VQKQLITLLNNILCKMGMFSLLLLAHSSSMSAQWEKPNNRDSLATQEDIVDLLHGKIKNYLRKGNSSQENKQVSFTIIPLDHQFLGSCNTNVLFSGLKVHLSGAVRYYNSPTDIYGIGNNTSLADVQSIQFSYLRAYQIAYRELAPNLFAGIGYNMDYHWGIEAKLASGKVSKEFNRLQKGSSSISSAISLNVQYDDRKNAINPQNGTYVNLQYRPNLTVFGSTQNWYSAIIDIRHYIKLPASSHNVLAFWGYSNITLAGTSPYLDMPSIGWDDCSNTGRGYTPGRFTGKNLVYFESEYRFSLTSNGLLGGVVFGNAGSILKSVTSDLHTILPGAGAGLRVKVDKYSNTNAAFDFGVGIGGSWSFSFGFGEAF
jgi:outer membrane protein assembly factor BamA